MDFKKLFGNTIQNIMKRGGPESVIGIDIGSSSVKIVQLRRKTGIAVLETYGTLALGPYADGDIGMVTNLPVEKITTALTDLIRESGVTTTEGAVAIPSASSLIFMIELPPTINESQYKDVVPTEARKYIPVPISEVTLDYFAIPKQNESEYETATPTGTPTPQKAAEKSEVLIAAIHKDTLQKYQDIVKAAALNASFFEIEAFSSIRSTFGRELKTVLLVDFGASKTKITIVESGIIKSVHIVNRGSFDITNALSKSLGMPFKVAEEIKRNAGLVGDPAHPNVASIVQLSVDYILAEMENVIVQYEKKYNRSVSKIVLIGGGALLKGFFEATKARFGESVVRGNPFAKVEAPAFLTPVLAEIGPEFAVALGLALRQIKSD